MINKQPERRFDSDRRDQYSLPTCNSHIDSRGYCELGPSTSELLGILRVLEDNGTGSQSS